VIFQLWEERYLGEKGLDSTLLELDIFPEEVIRQMSFVNGVPYGHEITIRHLLNHTSGLVDMKWDGAHGLHTDYKNSLLGAPDSLPAVLLNDEKKGVDAFARGLQAAIPEGVDIVEYVAQNGFPASIDLQKYNVYYLWPHWDYNAWKKDPNNKMAGIINFHFGGCNRNSLWRPGENYYYSDTGYIILAYVIERLTGNSFHYEQRKRIFEPLSMQYSFMDFSQDPEEESRRLKMSDMWALGYPCETFKIRISHDWGGGGQISTVKDLDRFIRALAGGELFKHKETFEEMLTYPVSHGETSEGIPFGYGGGIKVIGNSEKGYAGIGHTGSSGCWLIYSLETEVSFIGTVNEEYDDGAVRIYQIFRRTGKILRAIAPFVEEIANMME
jgi:CubicO group peptidase (beta-lactamase class C family)